MRPMERKLVHGFAIFEGIAFLGALILFLVIIGNTLVRIDDNLGSTRDSASGINASATTLPGLVTSITNELSAIDNDVKPVKGQLDSINGGLGTTQGGLSTANGNLGDISGKLTQIEGNLTSTDSSAHRTAVALIADNTDLGQAIAAITNLLAVAGGIQADASNIGAAATPIDQHLASIASKTNALCTAPILNLLSAGSCKG